MCCLIGWSIAVGQVQSDEVPAELKSVEIDQRIGEQIPLELDFFLEDGRPVRLNELFDGKRPVILTLNYYRCPMLCGLQLTEMIRVLKELEWTAGDNFRIVTVSFDSFEKPPLAQSKKETFMAEYGRPDAARGWNFLTGAKDRIERLTRVVGFKYRWVERRGEWAHSAGLIICTPTGTVSRYLGMGYDAKTLRMSLVEASEGKVGSIWDNIFLWCFHYDSQQGKYTAVAMRIMMLGGLVTVFAISTGLGAFWLFEFRRRRIPMEAVDGAAAGDGPASPGAFGSMPHDSAGRAI
jgi:protein SCO1/2